MPNLSFNEIKEQLNNSDFYEWNEFLNSYNFPRKYDDYYLKFILENNRTDELYLSSLIDLANDLGFYNNTLYKRHLKYLNHHNGFFVKDSALQYFRKNDDYFKEKKFINDMNLFMKNSLINIKKDGSVLKLLCYSIFIKYYQFKLDKDNEEFYYLMYIRTLRKCRTWQAVYRSKIDAESFKSFKKYRNEILTICKEKNAKYDLKIEY